MEKQQTERTPLTPGKGPEPERCSCWNPLLICCVVASLLLGIVVAAFGGPRGAYEHALEHTSTCLWTHESGFDDGCSEPQQLPTTPDESTPNITLVLGGMASLPDIEAAIAIPGLTNLILYNNEAATRCQGSSEVQGDYCGLPCADLLSSLSGTSSRARSSVFVECVDRPNKGRGEGGFFQHVSERYDSLAGVYIFSQSTLINDEGRLAPITSLVTGAQRSGPPECSAMEQYPKPMCPGGLLRAGASWSLVSGRPQQCADCQPNANASDGCHTLCNISIGDGTFLGVRSYHNVGMSEPPTMAAWLREYAPTPGDASVAPECFRGYVRTTATAIRRRPRNDYTRIFHDLCRCANPEASHFVERAMLYIFASV